MIETLFVIFAAASSGILGALIGLGGSLLGGLFGNSDQKKYYKAQTQLTQDITNKYLPQEVAGRNAAIGGLQQTEGFYDQYMQQGSPFLKSIQRASAEQITKQYDTAAGQSRAKLAQSGYGYAPSGIGAAVEGSLGRSRAQSTSEAYLNNLLQNEQVKFQAAGAKAGIQKDVAGLYNPAGLMSAGLSAKAPQSQSAIPGIISAGSNLLSSFIKKPTSSAPASAPTSFNPGTGEGWV